MQIFTWKWRRILSWEYGYLHIRSTVTLQLSIPVRTIYTTNYVEYIVIFINKAIYYMSDVAPEDEIHQLYLIEFKFIKNLAGAHYSLNTFPSLSFSATVSVEFPSSIWILIDRSPCSPSVNIIVSSKSLLYFNYFY